MGNDEHVTHGGCHDQPEACPDQKRGRLARFARCERGSLIIFSLFMMVAMLLVGGFAIDLIRTEVMRTRLQSTLDRALLAAADLEQPRAARDVVADYFARAGLADYAPAEITVEKKINKRRVCATTSADVNSIFLRLAGIDSFPAAGSGCAREHVPNLEISLVLDISGSMRYRKQGERKIDRLRPAASDFVEEMLKGERAEQTSISVVPYAGEVNPGRAVFGRIGGATARRTLLQEYRATPEADYDDIIDDYQNQYHEGHLKEVLSEAGILVSCDRDGEYEFDESDCDSEAEVDGGDDGTGDAIKSYYENLPDDEQYLIDTLHHESSCPELRVSDFGDTGLPDAGFYAQVPNFHYYTFDQAEMKWGWCPGPETAITYFSGDTGKLTDAIDGMQLYDGTGTHYAMRWALALLDPATNSLMEDMVADGDVADRFAERPAAWDDEETLKVIVLMTDGNITEQERPDDPAAPKNADTELQPSGGGGEFRYSRQNDNEDSFDQSCDLAKEQGVVVYTIAFNAGSGRDEMRSCATTPNHFYDVQGLEIDEAFNSIAGHINRLRLTR